MATLGKIVFGILLSDVLNGAKLYANTTASLQLGGTASEQQARVALELNDIIRQFLRDNPILLHKDTELSLLAGSNNRFEFPTDLRGMDIEEVRVFDNTIDGTSLPVEFISREQFNRYPSVYVPSLILTDYKCSVSTDGQYLDFYPPPPSGAAVKAFYNTAHTAITSANIASPDGVEIATVPIIARKYIELLLAAVYSDNVTPERSKELRDQAKDELMRIQRELTGFLGKLRRTHILDNDAILSKLGDDYYELS